MSLSQEVQALAQADFSAIAPRFSQAGHVVAEPAKGILSITRKGESGRPAVLISVGVHGDETGPMLKAANQIAGILNGIEGAEDVKVEQAQGLPFLEIAVDRAEVARRGLSVAAVQDVVAAAVGVAAAAAGARSSAPAISGRTMAAAAVAARLAATGAEVPVQAAEAAAAMVLPLLATAVAVVLQGAAAAATAAALAAVAAAAAATTLTTGNYMLLSL